jgi:hypothetical protein
MQHWVLCEVLCRLERQGFAHLFLVCTHSMAPGSVPESGEDEKFHTARGRIKNDRPSAYEEAWFSLSPSDGLPYPSSAMFAQHIWQKGLSMLLCEANPAVADEINGWLETPAMQARLRQQRLSRGDWRLAFVNPFVTGDADVLLIEMDPMRFEHHPPNECARTNRAVLFSEDVDLVTASLDGLTLPVMLQISSFSANNGNSHPIVEKTITTRLAGRGFNLLGRAMVGGQMLSLVFGRDISLFATPSDLETDFATWLRGIA